MVALTSKKKASALLEEIKSNDGLTIAIVVRKGFKKKGINFVSNTDYPLQLGINSYQAGHVIENHLHQTREVLINNVQEVLFFKRGAAIVSLFDRSKKFVKSMELSAGDLIFFVDGGHGFQMLKDTVLIEVKQGPYFGKDLDKVIIE